MPQLRGVERLEGPKRLKLNFRVNPGQYNKIRENKTQLNLLSKTKMKPWVVKEGNQNKTINPNSLSQIKNRRKCKENGSSLRPVMLTSKYSEILSTGIYKLDSATQTHSHILRRRGGGGTCTVTAISVPNNSTKHNIQNKVYIPTALWVKSYSVPDNFEFNATANLVIDKRDINRKGEHKSGTILLLWGGIIFQLKDYRGGTATAHCSRRHSTPDNE